MKFLNKIYRPSEDTFFLEDNIKNIKGDKLLEIGVGSGYLIYNIFKNFSWIVGTDISFDVLKEAKILVKNCDSKCNIDLICCDGASAFKELIFDLSIFNPPYLPSRSLIDLNVDGGMGGIMVIKKWIEQLVKVTKNMEFAIFVMSSISDCKKLFSYLKRKKIKFEIIGRRKIFFEELIAVKLFKS
jgi:release factor glutamine methyltransferase